MFSTKKEKEEKRKKGGPALWKSGKRKRRVSHFPTGPATRETKGEKPTGDRTEKEGGLSVAATDGTGPAVRRLG